MTVLGGTESGRVGYGKKYRVAGRVRVPAGHCCQLSVIVNIQMLKSEKMNLVARDGSA